MKTKRLTEKEINYNIFNALNLFDENLGELYLTNQFNPFDDNFVLTEDFVIERYTNTLKAKEINEPEFLIGGIAQTKTAFETSLNNCNLMLENIENKLNSTNLSPKYKEQLKKLKQYLLCRIALLNLYIKQLRKNKNTLKMYTSLQGLNWNYAETLDSSYTMQIDLEIVINALIQSMQTKQEKVNIQLKQKAKEIIQNNLKQQEKQNPVSQVKQEIPTKSVKEYSPTKEPTSKFATTKIQTKQSLSQKSTSKAKPQQKDEERGL